MPDPADKPLSVLALEPYYGGSHRAFLDGWRARSRHDWTLLTLPATKWKWRMRHAGVTFAQKIADADAKPDVLFCSDMLDLAQLKGLAPALAGVPAVVYFHENQLCYPVRAEDPRDLHFGYTNFTTALAANAIWFNSAFHRDAFFSALRELLTRMPDHSHPEAVDAIVAKSAVRSPGIDAFDPRPPRKPGPIRILWAGRWEHDKDPETFFAAVGLLAGRGVDFRLSVLGQRFGDCPPVFDEAAETFADRIDHWGYQECPADYRAALAGADVFVSTAGHEFFGLAAVEAIAAGNYPLLPQRLAYPELLGLPANPAMAEHYYDGTPEALADRLAALAETLPHADAPRRAVQRFTWTSVAPALDDALEAVL